MNIEISNLGPNGFTEVFVFRSKLDAVKIGTFQSQKCKTHRERIKRERLYYFEGILNF